MKEQTFFFPLSTKPQEKFSLETKQQHMLLWYGAQGLSLSQGWTIVRMDRIEDVRPQAPTKPDPVGYRPSRSSGMNTSHRFFSRSRSSGGLLRSTVIKRRNCLLSLAESIGRGGSGDIAEEGDGVKGNSPFSEVGVSGDGLELKLLDELLRDSLSIRRRISYTSRVKLRMRANK